MRAFRLAVMLCVAIPVLLAAQTPNDAQPRASVIYIRPAPQATSPLRRTTTAGPGYQFIADASGVHIGTTPAYGLDVAGNATFGSNLLLPATTATAGSITMAGVPFLHGYAGNTFAGPNAGNYTMDPAVAIDNVGIGLNALSSLTSGGGNVAVGAHALESATGDGTYGAAFNNTAIGELVLSKSTTATSNTGVGNAALAYTTTGCCNIAVGGGALAFNTIGTQNVVVGWQSDLYFVSGIRNVVVGNQAFMGSYGLAGGSNNVVIGFGAAQNYLGNNQYNVCIANTGSPNDSNTIRIGSSPAQNRAFIAGIRDVTTGGNDAVPVVIDSAGQLGTPSSSRRYKRDIADMAGTTDNLMRLRPVTFRYLAHGDNPARQFGLIAEEVAEIYPDLVTLDDQGRPDAVMYQNLAPMLLNEVQKEHRRIEELEDLVQKLAERLQRLEGKNAGTSAAN